MKAYFIVTHEAMKKLGPLASSWHGLDISATHKVVCAKFDSEGAEIAFEQDAGVQPLPHLLDGTPVSPAHVKMLGKFGVSSSDTTYSVAQKLAKHHPLMRPHIT